MLDANILAEVQKMKGGKMDKSYARRTNEKLGELSGFFGFKLIIEGKKAHGSDRWSLPFERAFYTVLLNR